MLLHVARDLDGELLHMFHFALEAAVFYLQLLLSGKRLIEESRVVDRQKLAVVFHGIWYNLKVSSNKYKKRIQHLQHVCLRNQNLTILI